MSTLPLLFADRYRRNSVVERPQKIGGVFSLELGQMQGPFLEKDFHLQNKNSIGVLTSRSFTRRSSVDANRIGSATYTSFSKHLAFIPEQPVFQQDEIQTFRTNSHAIQEQIKLAAGSMHQLEKQTQDLQQEFSTMRSRLEVDFNSIEQSVLSSFKQLRSKLFSFSRSDNNAHLTVVKREIASYRDTLECLKAHYEFADQKLEGLHKQFKGKEVIRQ